MALIPGQISTICDLLDVTDPDTKRIMFQTALYFDRNAASTEETDQIVNFLAASDKLLMRLSLAYMIAKEAGNDEEAGQLSVQITSMWNDLLIIMNSPTLNTITETYTHTNLENIKKLVTRLEFSKSHLHHVKHTDEGGKRSKRAKIDSNLSTDHNYASTSQQCVPSVKISNSYAILEEIDISTESGPPLPQESQSPAAAAPPTDVAPPPTAMDATISVETTAPLPKQPRVEPVFISVTGNWVEFVRNLNENILRTPVNVKLTGEYIKVPPATIEDYRVLTNYLLVNNIPFHALQPKAERPVKVLIKGLMPNTSQADIAAELIAIGVEPIHIQCIKNRRTGNPMPLFQCTLVNQAGWEKVYDLQHIHHMQVQIKAFHSRGVKQCYRCQAFGHSSQTCFMQPRCLKCAKSHHTRECTKSKNLPAQCVNCGGPHPANYSGCLANPRNIKPKPPKDPRRRQQNQSANSVQDQHRVVHVDAPLPVNPAWLRPNPAVLSPLPAEQNAFPPLPTQVASTVSAHDSHPQPTGPSTAEKRRAAAATSQRSAENLRRQHQEIVSDNSPSFSGNGVMEIFSIIQKIMEVVDIPKLMALLQDVYVKLCAASNPADQAFILFQAIGNYTTLQRHNN